jgi:aspartate aminotransferase-like enzyme
VDPKTVEEALAKEDYRLVCATASETSTGVAHPIALVGKAVSNYSNCYFAVDAITALGVVSLSMESDHIDMLVTGSQKALMLPPGLAFVGVSERAWKRMETVKAPRFYFNLLTERKTLAKDTTAWTPAVSLITGLHEVLQMMKEEGLDAIFKRHALMAEATREAAKAFGLKLYAPEHPSTAVTAIWMPEKDGAMLDGKKFVKLLRDRYNITIAGGQDDAEGKIFRIGHLGYYDVFDILTVWSAVELALKDMGHAVPLGKGTSRLLEVIHGRF